MAGLTRPVETGRLFFPTPGGLDSPGDRDLGNWQALLQAAPSPAIQWRGCIVAFSLPDPSQLFPDLPTMCLPFRHCVTFLCAMNPPSSILCVICQLGTGHGMHPKHYFPLLTKMDGAEAGQTPIPAPHLQFPPHYLGLPCCWCSAPPPPQFPDRNPTWVLPHYLTPPPPRDPTDRRAGTGAFVVVYRDIVGLGIDPRQTFPHGWLYPVAGGFPGPLTFPGIAPLQTPPTPFCRPAPDCPPTPLSQVPRQFPMPLPNLLPHVDPTACRPYYL